jgi:hypothetical protein
MTLVGEDRIFIVSGDGQEVRWGQLAPDSLKVRVLRADGTPLSDSFVNFVVSPGGGSVDPTSDVTDGGRLRRDAVAHERRARHARRDGASHRLP